MAHFLVFGIKHHSEMIDVTSKNKRLPDDFFSYNITLLKKYY